MFKGMIVVFLSALMVFFSVVQSIAGADSAEPEHRIEAYVAGKIYDFDGFWSVEEIRDDVEDIWVRIVNLETGKSREVHTKEDGCYSFKNVPEGTYSFSVYYKGNNPRMSEKMKGDFHLPEKIRVEKLENRPVVVAVCVVLAKNNKLDLLRECHVCLKSVPPVALLFLPPGVAAAFLIGAGQDEPASPFRPERK